MDRFFKDEDKLELPLGEMHMPGIRYNGTFWEECGIEPEDDVATTIECECGAASTNSPFHSEYCPLKESNYV